MLPGQRVGGPDNRETVRSRSQGTNYLARAIGGVRLETTARRDAEPLPPRAGEVSEAA